MVSVGRKYQIIDLDTGQLDRSIFADPDIYAEEQEKVFGRAWLMIGHESLVPRNNDYFHTYMGEEPVILCRDGRGNLRAFLNMCRHRGNRIVRTDVGNGRNFVCAYHGWTFSNEGELEYLPGEEEAYYGALERERLNLVEARVDTYAGIVFATWDHGAPSLDDYLGDARWLLDVSFNRLDNGTEALGPIKWMEPLNWKTAVDNCSDNYHVPTTHLSTIIVQGRHRGIPRLTHEQQFQSENKHLFVNGHSLTMRFLERADQARQTHGVTAENREGVRGLLSPDAGRGRTAAGSPACPPTASGQSQPVSQRSAGPAVGSPTRPAADRVLALRRAGKDMPDELKTALRRGSANYNGVNGIFEQGRYGQLAGGYQLSPHHHGAQVHPGPVDGHRPRQEAPRIPGRSGGAVHLGEQPAPVLPALGAVHERRELGGYSFGPQDHGIRGYGRPAWLGGWGCLPTRKPRKHRPPALPEWNSGTS